ncbi:MAG: hypothetical protein RBR18_15765 [Desulfovibrionaceae bacterium]|nr:hypothetical protein [Desulfovibrionaceae bacterium]
MGFWWLVAWAAVAVLGSFLRASPKSDSSAKPATMADIDVPTATEGRPVPVLFGTRLIENPNVVWWGDLRTVAIKSKGGGKK